jgi:DNA-binding PadR family transcriptional regulator
MATAGSGAELPATAWAVLGLLSFDRELSGYDLKKWADNSLRFFYWAPAISQVYGELRRLEKLGYVTSRKAPQDELRNKRMYRLTPAGRLALSDWVQHSPVDPPVLKHGVGLRVWLGHLADPDQLRRVVEEHRDYAQRMLDEACTAREIAEPNPEWAYPVIMTRWAERYYAAERDLTEELLADLESAGRAGPRAGRAAAGRAGAGKARR